MLGSRVSQTRTAAQRKVGTRPRPRQRDTVQPVRTQIRPFALIAIMSICTAGLIARLIYWQVLQHGQLAAMARSEYAALTLVTPILGQIYDANGVTLATDVTQDIVSAVPS
jgi:cell division protein FtsI/penicillin-binding protein 2